MKIIIRLSIGQIDLLKVPTFVSHSEGQALSCVLPLGRAWGSCEPEMTSRSASASDVMIGRVARSGSPARSACHARRSCRSKRAFRITAIPCRSGRGPDISGAVLGACRSSPWGVCDLSGACSQIRSNHSDSPTGSALTGSAAAYAACAELSVSAQVGYLRLDRSGRTSPSWTPGRPSMPESFASHSLRIMSFGSRRLGWQSISKFTRRPSSGWSRRGCPAYGSADVRSAFVSSPARRGWGEVVTIRKRGKRDPSDLNLKDL